MAITRTVAGKQITFDIDDVRRALRGVDPEAVREHFVVVDGQRYPPKQVLSAMTGLDRADYTTHQARRILQRAGLVVGRAGKTSAVERRLDRSAWPDQGREAEALAPYAGKWVAQRGLEVLFSAENPQEVVAWIYRSGAGPATISRVPRSGDELDVAKWR